MTMTPNRTCSAFPLNVKIDKADVGLENVDNTSDLDKPISNAVRDYMDKTISGAEAAISASNTAVETANTTNKQSASNRDEAKTYADNAASSALASETALSKAEVYAANASASADKANTYATNAKASADTAAATLSNTVDLSSKQTVTGAKTFAGDTTITGSFATSGNAEMAQLDIDSGKLTVGSSGSVTINGALTAPNASNSISVGDHDKTLNTTDVLNAKDIMTSNGSANNLIHRDGAIEAFTKWIQFYNMPCIHQKTFGRDTSGNQWVKCFSYLNDDNYYDGIIDVEVFTGHSYSGMGKTTLEILRRNHTPVCYVKDCCDPTFVVGRLPTTGENGACVINDGEMVTLYIYTCLNRPAYRVTFATIINSWAESSSNPEYNLGCCTRYAFDDYPFVTVYDEIVDALPTDYVSITYPKVVTPKS
jgi:hypothetical protein